MRNSAKDLKLNVEARGFAGDSVTNSSVPAVKRYTTPKAWVYPGELICGLELLAFGLSVSSLSLLSDHLDY